VRRKAPGTGTRPLAGIPGASRFPRDLARLRALAERLHGGPVDLSVAVVSDREIRRLHRRWLGADRATDVVSFPLSGPRDEGLVGAIAVSRDTARREAARRGHAAYHELMLYVVHGVLHLLGHDDHGPRARARMRRAERDVLASLGLPPVFGPDAGREGP
jgi:probable rRNA maturation factor